MTPATDLIANLEAALGDRLTNLTPLRQSVVRAELNSTELLMEVALTLRNELGFNHCSLLTGVDYIDVYECVYHLCNTSTGTMVELHTLVDKDHPHLPSLVSVWEGINWHEREAFDLMGLVFEDHPRLERVLLPQGFEGHPLRKDYVYRIHEEEW